jgi:hypothetical protein
MRRSLYRDEEHVKDGGDDEQHDVESLLLLLHRVYMYSISVVFFCQRESTLLQKLEPQSM